MEILEKICNPVVKEIGYFLIYVALFNMKGINSGLYKLDTKGNNFEKIGKCPSRVSVCKLISGMNSSMTSGMTLFLVVDLDAAMVTISESAYLRRVFVESGIIMQRILTGLTFRNISGVPSPAIQDVNTKRMLGLDENRNIWPLYSCALGYKK